MLSSQIFPVGLPLSRGASSRVRSTSRGGRSPSAPKAGAVPNGAAGSGAVPNGVAGAGANGFPGRGRRSRSVTKVGIKLGAYRVTLRRRSVCAYELL